MSLQKRSIKIEGHRTSVALEPEFWSVLERVASLKGESLSRFIASLDRSKAEGQSLASACRLCALTFVIKQQEAA